MHSNMWYKWSETTHLTMELQAFLRFFGSICGLGNVCQCLAAIMMTCAIINVYGMCMGMI